MYFINLPSLNTKDYKDRFDLQKFVEFNVNVYDLLDSYFVNKIVRLPVYGTTFVQAEENRADLLAYRIYGSVKFWYILMIYNGIVSPMDIVEGQTINYPRVDDIETVYFSLNALQRNNVITG